MSVTRLFLDASGSAPLSPRVQHALNAGLTDGWADPARVHSEARRARALVDGAREAIADEIGVQPEHLFFTASPHHAFERLISGVYAARRGRERIVATAVERDAALQSAAFVAPESLDVLPVDREGHLDPGTFEQSLHTPDVAVALVQHANQEIGTVQDLETLYPIAHTKGVPVIVDATASVGHIDPPEHWDALVAHPADWGGPAGIGVVALRPQTRWLPTWPEGDDWAPGGVNVALALASAVALQERTENRAATEARLRSYVDRIRMEAAHMEGVYVVGDADHRLPHVVTLAFLYLDGEPLLTRLDKEGIAVGSGSACSRSTLDPSHVMAAIGALTHGNVRLGLHPGVSEHDIDRFLEALPRAIEYVRQDMGATA